MIVSSSSRRKLKEGEMNITKVVGGFDEAVADIPNGATIMLGGFGVADRPFNLIRALRNQNTKGLTIIANSPGTGGQQAAKWWGKHLIDPRPWLESVEK